MVLSTLPTDTTPPPVSKFSARLVVRGGGEQAGQGAVGLEPGGTFELQADRVTIGRTPENGIQIDHPSVSSNHALIRRVGGDYLLLDIGSTNGTWVNDSPVTGQLLENGSRISIGESSLFFTQVGSTAAKPGAMGVGSRGTIMVQSGPSAGSNFPIGDGDLVIGRQPGDGGAKLDEPSVEARHAMVRPTADGCRLFDLGGTAGTKVNDVELAGTVLNNGDVIKFGGAELEFVRELSS